MLELDGGVRADKDEHARDRAHMAQSVAHLRQVQSRSAAREPAG